jgi:hypothetical protein
MSCWVEVGDTFVWQHDHKGAQEGDTVEVECIRVDEDAVAWVDIINYRNEPEKVRATDIQGAVQKERLARVK